MHARLMAVHDHARVLPDCFSAVAMRGRNGTPTCNKLHCNCNRDKIPARQTDRRFNKQGRRFRMSIFENRFISRRRGGALSMALVTAALAFTASPAAAATSGTATANVNLRAGPGTNYPVVITLAQSAPLTVHGCTSNTSWCDVSWGAERGWVAANYIYVSYQGTPTVVTASIAPVVGITAVTFSVAYWDSHYRHHHWYHDWEDYSRKTVAGCNGDGCGAASVTRGPHGGGRAAAVGCNDNGCAAGSVTHGPRGAGRAAVGGFTDERADGHRASEFGNNTPPP
jgi:uncharacterized protein YraI